MLRNLITGLSLVLMAGSAQAENETRTLELIFSQSNLSPEISILSNGAGNIKTVALTYQGRPFTVLDGFCFSTGFMDSETGFFTETPPAFRIATADNTNQWYASIFSGERETRILLRCGRF